MTKIESATILFDDLCESRVEKEKNNNAEGMTG
jgi:hypothetical protein